MMEASAVVLLLALSGAVAGPVEWQSSNKCSTRCPDSLKFKYQAGWSYEYHYEAETRTTLAGAAQDVATVAISATARVEVMEQCEMALKLSDVVIQRSHEEDTQRMVNVDDMSLARNALERRSLRFAFSDGQVGDLCPDVAEELWVLNIKRGVLSSFQNSMRQMERAEQLQEVDVTGRCPTHYKVTQQGWKSLTVTKVKDVLACMDRQDYRSALTSVPYTAANGLQSLPLMKSSHECTQVISKEEGVLQRTTCHEVHVFRPFSKANSGAITEASHTLTFRSKSAGIRSYQGPVSRRASLLFEHKQGASEGESVYMDVKNKVKEMCDLTKDDIRPEVPRVFAELVHMMRNLDYSDLQDINRQIEQDRLCPDNAQKSRKFFQDALPMVATGASLRLMSDLLMSEQIADAQATFWLTSLAFLPNPTKDVIAALEPLLRNTQRQQDAMLPVSSLVNNYCEGLKEGDCTQHEEVLKVMEALTNILGPQCQVDDSNHRLVLVTLRAIGNIGRSEVASLRLEKCFTQSELPMDVRVAALDAYRRMPCSADRSDVMEVFLRQSEDSELRITAYLVVMQCPSDAALKQVRQALLDEKVNQVGSFVWTHLTNLLETESPHKQAIRDVLENELLQKEFRKDSRKFSRNSEVSFFSEKFNVGGTFESNLIWSPSSFVPRSAMVNLTVDMFGHSVNFLELGGRVQGLEDLLLTYFGAEGSGKGGGYGQTDAIKSGKLVRTINNYDHVKDSLRGQAYLRMFGNELAYGMMDGSSLKKLREGKAESFFEDLAKKLMKDGQVSFTQSAVIMDTTIVIPTVAGLPLNLTVNGSASVDLQASQKMDFKKISAKSKAFSVDATLQPSGAVELASTMGVDAFVTQVGLKMTSRLHTSTALKGRMELARGQILSVELDMPRDTLDIFDFQSRFFVVHDSHQKEQQMIAAHRQEATRCSGEAMANVVGVELCASLSFPNATTAVNAPYFPFTGPASVSITLRKHDVHSGYKLLAKQIKSGSSLITQVALDTPGSKVDRAISIGYVANLKAQTLEADLLSPWKKVSAKVSWERTKKLLKTDAFVTIDADKKYSLLAQVDKDIKIVKEVITTAKVEPSLEVKSEEGQLMLMKGSLDYKQNKQLKSNMVIEMKDVLKKPINMDYSLIMRGREGKMRYKNSLRMSSPFASVKGSMQALVGSFTAKKKSGVLLKLRSRMDYDLHHWPSVKKNIVSLGLKLNDRSTAALNKYGVNMNFDSKRHPEANLLVNGEVSHKTTLTKVEMAVRHGKNIKMKADKSKEMVLAGFVAHKIADPQAMVNFDLKAIYPDMLIEYQLKGKHEHNKRSMEDYLTLRYAKGKSIDAHLRLSQVKKKRSATFDLTYPAGENYPARIVKINTDLTEKTDKHHVLSALVSPQKGERHSFVVSYKRPTPTSLEISSDINLHKRKPINLDFSSNLAMQGMVGQGKLTAEGKTYRLTYASTIEKDGYANLTATFIHPERRVEVGIEGGWDSKEAVKRGKVEVLWDADKDLSQKMGGTVEVADKVNADDINYGGMVEAFTPFEDYRHMKGELRFENSEQRILAITETVMGEDDRIYSAKFTVVRPITVNSFKTQAWLKTPHDVLRHLEAKADHVFEESGKLSTILKGVFNRHSAQVGVSGSKKGDLVVRQLEGEAFFKSTLPGVENYRLSFNHRDVAGRYNSQTVLDANGDQYSVVMEASFQKVHYQITTSGEVSIRAPQLMSPVKVTWNHKNSLHEMTSSMTVDLPQQGSVQLDVEGTANVVTKVYEAQATLRGPWLEDDAEHVSKLDVNFAKLDDGYDLTADLQLQDDTYQYFKTHRQTEGSYEETSRLTMSRFPEYNSEYDYSFKYADFPYMVSIEMKRGGKPYFNLDMEIENPKNNKYVSTGRLIFALEEEMKNVAISASTEKTRRGQWVTKGDLEYEIGKRISFSSAVDIERKRKGITLNIDTPFDKAPNIRLEYSHSGNVKEDFTATCSLSAQPMFDEVKTTVSWSTQDRLHATLRVDIPFKKLRSVDLKTETWVAYDGRHSTLELEYSPNRVYKLDTLYRSNIPDDLFVKADISTPHRELPSLSTEFGYSYSKATMDASVKLSTPVLKYDQIAITFGQQQRPKSYSSQAEVTIGSENVWKASTDLNWNNKIDGSFNVENNGEGRQKVQLLLSHKGNTWEDFRSKVSFKMNGDRLESEVAYSNGDGRSGLFMLATPNPDIDFFKTTFFQRLTTDKFEGRYTVQYGEESKPYEIGLMTVYSENDIGFSTDLKTPHTEDLSIEIGFARKQRVEIKLSAMYGPGDKVLIHVKYGIRKDYWNVGGDFEYRVQGSGRNMGLMFLREGPLDNLKCSCTAKYMGKEVEVDTHLYNKEKVAGTLQVRSNFKDYSNLAASFNHSGNSEKFETSMHLKYKDDKEASGTVDFQRNKWKRIQVTATLNLPVYEFQENKLTYKQVNRKNKVSAEGSLKLGYAHAINGELEFVDNSKLTVSVKGPYKDFRSLTATGSWDNADKVLEGDATIDLISQATPITATYMARAGMWPVMINVKAQTPFQGWESVELDTTHDGEWTDFTTSHSLTAAAVGTVHSEVVWTYSSPSALYGLWTLTSSVKGAENLKLSLKNSRSGDEYNSRLIIGWELLKEMVVDAAAQFDEQDNWYKGSLSMTSPIPEASQFSVSFDHTHDDNSIQDSVLAHFNDQKYLDVDFRYNVGDRRVGTMVFRAPQPMEFVVGGQYSQHKMEGELKLNWDKRHSGKNLHLLGDYNDYTDRLGTDSNMKLWVIHPARSMGVEYMLKRAAKEFQTDFLLSWDKASGQTVSYVVNWTDRRSRYSTSYDAMVKVGVPTRSVQVEGLYSDTGRVRSAEGSVLWDADQDKNLKVGMKGQLDTRGNTRKVQLGLDLPFVSKEYGLTTETTINSGSRVLDARTEFSYSPDPRKLLVFNGRIDKTPLDIDTHNYSVTWGVLHPITDLDIQVTSHVGVSPRTGGSAGTRVSYTTAEGGTKVVELRGHLDKPRKVMGIELKTPMKELSLEGELSGDREYTILLVKNEDGQRSQLSELFVNPETRTVEITYWYDKAAPSNSVKLFGHMVSDRLLQTELYRVEGGSRRVSETLMTVRLNSSHVLHTRINWRPDMLRDFQQYVGTQLTVFSYGSSEAFQAVAQQVGREVEVKYQAIMREIQAELGPLLQHLQKEMENLQGDLDSMQKTLRRFYYRNALHVQELNKMTNNLLESMVMGMQRLVLQFRQFQTGLQQDLGQWVQQMGQFPMAQRYAQLVADFAAGLKNTREVLERALDVLSVQLGTFSDLTYRKYMSISRQIDRKLQGYTAALQQSAPYQGLQQVYGSARSGLGRLSSANYQKLAAAANATLLKALARVGLKGPYLAVVTRTKQLIADQFHDLVARPEFQQIYVIGSEIYQQSIWALHYLQVEQNMHLAASQLLKLAKDLALLEITRIKNAVVDLDKSRIITYDPQNGELQFEVYLPVSLNSLAEPPELRVSKYVKRIRSWVTTYIPTPQHSLWAYVNSYLPSLDTETWLPPFTAHAFVLADQHVVTFDQTHYNFAGRCTYILARDMADDRFTVILRYNNRPRRPQVQSVIVLLRGVAFEVDTDNKVRVNDKETELPFFSGPISAVHRGGIVRVQDGQALTVEIDHSRSIYGVALSGWYHGRTAGLLGTYDNEPFNDLTDSRHQVTEDLEAFANSWEVSRRYCRSRNMASVEEDLDDKDRDVQACQKFLSHSSSYFSPCFSQVDPKELVAVCVSYVKSGVIAQEAQCKAGQHYRYICGQLGIALGTPAECVSCGLPGKEERVGLGQAVVVQEKAAAAEKQERRSADVVFVLEESACNAWTQESLPALATYLSTALKANGMSANRFGLVSYSGNNSMDQPWVHTIEGEVFGVPRNFLKATENLRVNYPGKAGDAGSALREAMKYPFRTGVAKILVLLPCSACVAGGDLFMLQQVMGAHGFMLHVINAQNFAANAGADGDHNASPVRIFGVDNKEAHLPKSSSQRGEEILSRVAQPQGLCSQLAFSTNGSVFDAGHMRARPSVRKEFLGSFAYQSARKAVVPQCEVCSCHDDGNGRGHTVCRLCDSSPLWNHIPTWLQSSSSGVMGVVNHLHHQIITSLDVPEVFRAA